MQYITFLNRCIKYCANKRNQRDGQTWVLGEWFGKRTGDNVTFYANYLAKNYRNLNLYWLCDKSCNTSGLDKRINVLDFTTREAVEISKKSAVAVMGEGISDLSHDITNYWGNAVKVNLWHGVMWKKIGHDAEKIKPNPIIRVLRNRMYYYDLYETPSNEYSKHFKTAFYAENQTLLNCGLPRNSLFFDSVGIENCRRKILKKLFLHDSDQLIAYLPTFRDSHSRPFSFTDIKDHSFHNWIKSNNIYILQKAHAAEIGAFGSSSENIINVTDFSAQEIMAASNMLITDYSSCFFDYLLLDRPIIHYLYDYVYYKNKDRGLYYDKEDVVCGSVPETEEELIKAIKNNIENPALYHDLRMKRKEKFMTFENPDSCEIITQRIFEELRKRGISVT